MVIGNRVYTNSHPLIKNYKAICANQVVRSPKIGDKWTAILPKEDVNTDLAVAS